MNWPTTVKSGNRRTRLLVVDDMEQMRDMIAQSLHQAGYEVEMAANADDALQLAQLVRWDGVILDIDLPGMNGVELYARILRNHTNGRLPVLFISGRPNQALELGLNGVPWAKLVQKPYGFRKFLVTLEQCLRADEETTPGGYGQAAPLAGD